MTTRHAQPCRCADCIDGENRLVRPAAIASAAPSPVQCGWIDEFGNVFPMGAWKPALRTWEDAHKVPWEPVYRATTPAQAPAIPRVEDFVDGAIPDIQDEGGTLVYYSRSAVHECIESVVYALTLPAQAPAIQAPEPAIIQEIEYARDHGWPFECRGRLEAMAAAWKRRAALATPSAAVSAAEPVAWVRCHPDGTLTEELLPDRLMEPVRKASGGWLPLVAPTQPKGEAP